MSSSRRTAICSLLNCCRDNPRKALLTTVKEAVDNSIDACEEAGSLPEIWMHIEQTGKDRYKGGFFLP